MDTYTGTGILHFILALIKFNQLIPGYNTCLDKVMHDLDQLKGSWPDFWFFK